MPLQLAPGLESFELGGKSVQLGLAGMHQRLNAAMAIQLCRLWALRARAGSLSSAAHELVGILELLLHGLVSDGVSPARSCWLRANFRSRMRLGCPRLGGPGALKLCRTALQVRLCRSAVATLLFTWTARTLAKARQHVRNGLQGLCRRTKRLSPCPVNGSLCSTA